jgi:hypothetical protein
MFILCNANQFVQRHGREGLNCGKCISEEGEAIYYGFDDVEWDLIDQSNERFASIVSKYFDEPMDILYQKILHDYELIASTNPIDLYDLSSDIYLG